jgi:hypothetical protein
MRPARRAHRHRHQRLRLRLRPPFLEAELETEPIAAALGVFYVFKDEALRQQFLASRYRRQAAAPRKRVSEQHFEEHRQLLEPFVASMAQR